MQLISRKGCILEEKRALCERAATQGIDVSLQIQPVTGDERARFAECVGRIARDNCRSSFAELFEHYAPRLKSYLMRLGSDAAQAEEVVQDVMLNVWRKAAQYNPAQASVSTWIFRIARNRQIDTIRRLQRPELDPDDPMLQPAESEAPDRRMDRLQIEDIVREQIETLPEEQLSLLKAAFYEGLTHSEIAKSFDLPLGTVKSRIRLAFQRLRNSLPGDL